VLSQHGAPIAPSTYYAAKSRPPSARAVRDQQLNAEITRVWKENYEVYGADKVWLELHRQGIAVARCTTERLMRGLGLAGVRRGRQVRTTVPGKGGHRAGDLLGRDFTAPAPNRRWVADFTYVAAWSGIVYVAFVVDIYSRAIVGWSAATHKRAKLVLDALQMARWRRDRDRRPAGPGLVHHSDAGSAVHILRLHRSPDRGRDRRLDRHRRGCSGQRIDGICHWPVQDRVDQETGAVEDSG
jgi:putative transposase